MKKVNDNWADDWANEVEMIGKMNEDTRNIFFLLNDLFDEKLKEILDKSEYDFILFSFTFREKLSLLYSYKYGMT
ncbi:MAG: hypothetical protein AABY22_27480 [Nanoarchaeota archaeon]